MPIPREQLDRALGIARENERRGNHGGIPEPTETEKAYLLGAFDKFVYSSGPKKVLHIPLADESIPEGETPPLPACETNSGSHGEKNWLTSRTIGRNCDRFCYHCVEAWRDQVRLLLLLRAVGRGVKRLTPLD